MTDKAAKAAQHGNEKIDTPYTVSEIGSLKTFNVEMTEPLVSFRTR